MAKEIKAMMFGAVFALGWTPCIGPILGTVLLLASTTATVGDGMLLLLIFSLGMAVPFLLIAASWQWAVKNLKRVNKYLGVVRVIGGIFLVGLGGLMVTDKLGVWVGWTYNLFKFVNYERLLNYL